MGESKKAKMQKKLEMLKKTQEIASFVEESNIKNLATLGGVEDSQPAEESHALSLLEETTGITKRSGRRSAKKTIKSKKSRR